MTEYDRFLTRSYLRNALSCAADDTRLRQALIRWIAEGEDELRDMDADFLTLGFRAVGLEGAEEDDCRLCLRLGRASVRDFEAAKARDYLAWASGQLDESLREAPREDAEARATALAVRRFDLTGACGPVLELARLYEHHGVTTARLWQAVRACLPDHISASATALGTSRSRIERAFRELTDAGIAVSKETWGRPGAEPNDYVKNWFVKVYRPPVTSERELRERLVPLAPEPLLELDAFDHLDARSDAVRLLKAAAASREGVRLLLYGRAGTGKTEFAKTVVRATGGRLYDPYTSEHSSVGIGRSAEKRNRLRMALALLKREPEAVVLCDEVDDVLSSERGHRLENHRLLENAPIPIVFTGNDLLRFDEAILRRFDLTIRFKAHSPTRRRSVVRRMLQNSGIESLAGEALERLAFQLADELECPPGIIERAIRSTRLLQGSAGDLFRLAERHERTIATHIRRPRLGPPVKGELPWQAFGHLGQSAADFRRLFRAALGARRDGHREGRGISFLAYGAPGCGKTEFCRTLAAEAGAMLYSIGGREHGPESRLPVPRRVSLEYAIEALADEPEAVILFDEIEDFVFDEAKHWLNELVETAPVPMLFTANSTDALRRFLPHFLDRLTYSMEFRRLPRARRTTMFADLLGAGGSAEMASLSEELATDRRVTPRHIRNAGLVAVLSGGGAEAARRAVREKARLLRGKGTAEPRAADRYDFSLVHAEPDLDKLTARIGQLGRCRLGILLDGPSGTGKSEYAKQVARRMGLDPLPKRASELMSKWVGETEQQIAGAFAEARATNRFLIVDEADSFLADRRAAHRNWEISTVNEMLSQLESHDLPYAFTTNLAGRLDPAVARRFLFRATFKFLDESRVAKAWQFFFGGECPVQVRNLTCLVPADFALVHERAEKLGFLDDAGQIAGELVSLAQDKNRSVAVGFRRGRGAPDRSIARRAGNAQPGAARVQSARARIGGLTGSARNRPEPRIASVHRHALCVALRAARRSGWRPAVPGVLMGRGCMSSGLGTPSKSATSRCARPGRTRIGRHLGP